jgi:hypothetical protein
MADDFVMPIGNGGYTPLTPLWWVHRLYTQLQHRMPIINKYDDYYRGDFPLPWLAPQAEDDFKRIMKMSRVNFTGLVCDAQVERMSVEGFRINDPAKIKPKKIPRQVVKPPTSNVIELPEEEPSDLGDADMDMWRIWQANNLDTYFDQGLLEAAITGQSYLLVAPNPKDAKTPKMWVEHSSQCIVEHYPGGRTEVAAGLKVWNDDWTDEIHCTLYLPDKIYKYRAKSVSPGARSIRPRWERRGVKGEQWPAPNRLGEVPIFELPNNPRLLTGGRSELEDLCDTQDRIIKTVVDRLMTQDFGAFPAKWATGWPDKDAQGNTNPEIQVGQNRMIISDVMETKFGQFAAADLMGYIASKLDDVKDMASRSRTPAQYLLGDLSNVNGETLVASESGLVSKCGQRSRGMDGGLEGAARLTRAIAGISSKGDESMEVMWKNPGFRTEGELVSALVQMGTLGVPQEALWERWGATQTEIARWKVMRDEAARQMAMNDATALLGESFRAQQDAKVTGSIGGRTPRRTSGRTTGGSGSAGAGGNGTGRPGGAGVAKATAK